MLYAVKLTLILLTLAAFAFIYFSSFVNSDQPESNNTGQYKSSFKRVFNSHSIFFIETSGRRYLRPRQACAVESAARSNPGTSIHVMFFNYGLNETHQLFVTLEQYRNVDFTSVNFDEYLAGTPLERWKRISDLEKSPYRLAHTSDMLRLVTLQKYGGIYLDLDVVVTRNLRELGCNWAGFESPGVPGNSALCFDTSELGRRFTKDAIMGFRDNYADQNWGFNGPGLVSRVMRSMCTDGELPGQREEARCRGLRLLPPEYFYPIPYYDWESYFREEQWEEVNKFGNKTYLHHLWNKLSENAKTEESLPYSRLSKRFCPKVYNLTKYYF